MRILVGLLIMLTLGDIEKININLEFYSSEDISPLAVFSEETIDLIGDELQEDFLNDRLYIEKILFDFSELVVQIILKINQWMKNHIERI